MGGRGSGSNMASSSSGMSVNSPENAYGGNAYVNNNDPLFNKSLPLNDKLEDYFNMIGYDYSKLSNNMIDAIRGGSAEELESYWGDIKSARIKAEKLPKTGNSYMDKSSNVKDYYMATMASPGESRAAMNKYWSTTPGKVDLAEWFKGEIDAGLTSTEMKSVIDSVKKRRK